MKTTQAVVMVTRRCNMSCAHCSVESHPKLKKQPSEDELRHLVDQLLDAGVRTIQFTGGEPMLRGELVMELMQRAKAKGVPSTMVSNGFWGKKKDRARSTLKKLLDSGLTRLALSYDRFHTEFQGPEPLLNILEAVEEIDWTLHINITRSLDDKDLDQIVEPFRNHPNAQLRFYDIQPVGLAKNLQEELRSQLDGFCSACGQVTFTDNGRVIACNGPAYFEKTSSPLVVGEHRSGKTSVEALLETHAADPILETIRVDGPLALKEALLALPGFSDYPFKEHYSGMCELCLELNADPKAVKVLRAHLNEPAVAAQRLARKLVLQEARRQDHHRHAINYQKAPEAFLKLLLGQADQDMRRVLGRADLDWAHQARHLSEAGLLPLLKSHQENPLIKAWAPHFFWSRVKEAESKAEVLRKENIRRVEETLVAARDLGLSLRPWGSTQLLLDGNPRVTDVLEFASGDPVSAIEVLLEQRLGYRLLVYPESEILSHQHSRTALEILQSWWQRSFRGGLESCWDLHHCMAQSEQSWDQLDTLCDKRGLRTTWCLLAKHLELKSFPTGASKRLDSFSKILRHQMYQPLSARTNILLEAVIPVWFCDQWSDLPKKGAESLSRLSRALKELWRAQGLGGLLQTLRKDTWQALEAASLISRKRKTFIQTEALAESGVSNEVRSTKNRKNRDG